MKFSIYISLGHTTSNKWYLRNGHFTLLENKIGVDFKPDYFDTVEAAMSKKQQLINNGEDRPMYIQEWKTPLHIEKASIATDEHLD